MSDNPLKQYFRRPSIYIKLPSDYKYYNQGVIDLPENLELPVYPMTAIDEITAKTPDALFNGQAIVDIIHSCLPNIKNAWHINSIDLETIMIAIRVASNGEYMDVNSECPECKEETEYSVDLIELLRQQKNIDYETTISIGDLKIKFRPLTYKEINNNGLAQYEIQKIYNIASTVENAEEKNKLVKKSMDDLNHLMIDIIASTIDYIETPETKVTDKTFIKEYLNSCDRKESEFIKEHSGKLKSENELKPLNFKCIHCSHEYQHKLVLNITDFFD